jgi:hypothetical protein
VSAAGRAPDPDPDGVALAAATATGVLLGIYLPAPPGLVFAVASASTLDLAAACLAAPRRPAPAWPVAGRLAGRPPAGRRAGFPPSRRAARGGGRCAGAGHAGDDRRGGGGGAGGRGPGWGAGRQGGAAWDGRGGRHCGRGTTAAAAPGPLGGALGPPRRRRGPHLADPRARRGGAPGCGRPARRRRPAAAARRRGPGTPGRPPRPPATRGPAASPGGGTGLARLGGAAGQRGGVQTKRSCAATC